MYDIFEDWFKEFIKIYKDNKNDNIYKRRFTDKKNLKDQFIVIKKMYEMANKQEPDFYRCALLIDDIILTRKMEFNKLISKFDNGSAKDYRILSDNINILVEEMELLEDFKESLERKHNKKNMILIDKKGGK